MNFNPEQWNMLSLVLHQSRISKPLPVAGLLYGRLVAPRMPSGDLHAIRPYYRGPDVINCLYHPDLTLVSLGTVRFRQ